MNRCTVEHCHGQEWFQGEGLCRQHLLEELEQVPVVESTTDLTTSQDSEIEEEGDPS